jgi:ubiquinone/menaquinone biosynthesis C-methylase UbiE
VAEKPNYTLGHGDHLVRAFSRRDSTREAQFFLPHLKPGMSLLDCGCGPGTITVGLAKIVAPGHVTGIDICSEQFELGRRLAAEHSLANVSFEQGDVAELRFDDASFDAVFAHGVLYHLSDPHVALNEMRRVLRPGGLLGIRDTDEAGTLFGPRTPLLERAHAAAVEAWRRNGTNPFFGRLHCPLMREAGFDPISFSASYDNYVTSAETRGLAEFSVQLLRQPHMSAPLLESGWTTTEELDAMCAALEEWAFNGDAFFARARCETVAVRP